MLAERVYRYLAEYTGIWQFWTFLDIGRLYFGVWLTKVMIIFMATATKMESLIDFYTRMKSFSRFLLAYYFILDFLSIL